MINLELENLKKEVQEIIDYLANNQTKEANNKLLEVSEKLDEILDHTDDDEDLMQISHFQVLLNQLHVKINPKEND
jgi:molecular chaperone GrpE (heat shock protein)